MVSEPQTIWLQGLCSLPPLQEGLHPQSESEIGQGAGGMSLPGACLT